MPKVSRARITISHFKRAKRAADEIAEHFAPRTAQAVGAKFGAFFVCRTCIAPAEWSRATKLITTRERSSLRCQRCRTHLAITPPAEPIGGQSNA